MHAVQVGQSSDPKTASALQFAIKIVSLRAQVSSNDVRVLCEAGFGDEAIVEILTYIALNLFTNYINLAFDIPVDFPNVKHRSSAQWARYGFFPDSCFIQALLSHERNVCFAELFSPRSKSEFQRNADA